MSWRGLHFDVKLMIFDYLDAQERMDLASCSTEDLEDFFNSISCIKSVNIEYGQLERIYTRNGKRYLFNWARDCLYGIHGSASFDIKSKKVWKMIENYRKKVLMSNYSELFMTGDFEHEEEILNLRHIEKLSLRDVPEDLTLSLLSKTDNLTSFKYENAYEKSDRISACEMIYKIDSIEIDGLEFTDDQFLKFESRKIVIENHKITQNGINKFIENWSTNKEKENFNFFIIEEMSFDEPKWDGSQNYVRKRDDVSYLIENQWNEKKRGIYSKNGGNSVMFRIDFD